MTNGKNITSLDQKLQILKAHRLRKVQSEVHDLRVQAQVHPRGLQVRPGPHADRDGLEFGAHAQELAAHAHEREADGVQHPPREAGRQVAVVHQAEDGVEEVHREREVQTQLGALHHVPQRERAEKIVKFAFCKLIIHVARR